MFIPVF